MIRIGTAGWAIPAPLREGFTDGDSILERYAARFNAVEINSSFYRPHRPETYRRWAASVPDDFKFAVKLPKSITHQARLKDVESLTDRFLAEVSALGAKLGPLLVQLPPSLAFDSRVAAHFFAVLRGRMSRPVCCEPRHATWFTNEADVLLRDYMIARVAADPAPVPGAAVPGGWNAFAYLRLHGSPRMYYSEYGQDYLIGVADTLRTCAASNRWCIFDNTARGAATTDALALARLLSSA